MDENLNVAANTEEVATPQDTVEITNTEVTTEPTEVVETKDNMQEPAKEDLTQTQAFSKRLKEATEKAKQEARDAYIAEQGYEWNGQPITTEAQYKQALREKELYDKAVEDGKDPNEALWKAKVEEELNSSKSLLANYELKEKRYIQDEQLSNDPQIGAIYKEWRNDVKALAEKYTTDYDIAFTILTRERISEVLGKAKIQTEQETIKGLQQNAQTTPGALGIGGQEAKQDFSKMTSKDFDEVVQKALRGELSKF